MKHITTLLALGVLLLGVNMTQALENTGEDIGVSEGFNPLQKCDANGVANDDGPHWAQVYGAQKKWDANPGHQIQGYAFPVATENPKAYAEICGAIRGIGYSYIRGIIFAADLGDPENTAAAEESLRVSIKLGLENGVTKFFTICEGWPAQNTGRDFDTVVLPTAAKTLTKILLEFPEVEEFGIEFLISAEQENMNSLAKCRRLVNSVHTSLGKTGETTRRMFVVPDSAHLYGLVDKAYWGDLTQQLADACERGEVSYIHVSVPETRSDRILDAAEDGSLPLAGFIGAVKNSSRPITWALEYFNQQSPALEALRAPDGVKRFRWRENSGWTDGKRFERANAAAIAVEKMFAE